MTVKIGPYSSIQNHLILIPPVLRILTNLLAFCNMRAVLKPTHSVLSRENSEDAPLYSQCPLILHTRVF